jgi:hypothetical protein
MIEFKMTYGGFRTWLTEQATKEPRGIAGQCGSPYECPIARYVSLFMPPEISRVVAEGQRLKGLKYVPTHDGRYVEETGWTQETPRWTQLFMQKVDAGNYNRITNKGALTKLDQAANDMARYYPKEEF